MSQITLYKIIWGRLRSETVDNNREVIDIMLAAGWVLSIPEALQKFCGDSSHRSSEADRAGGF